MKTKTSQPKMLSELQREISALLQENIELYAENERLYRRCHPVYWLRMIFQKALETA